MNSPRFCISRLISTVAWALFLCAIALTLFLGNAIADVVFDCDLTVFHPMHLTHNAPVPGGLNFFVATISVVRMARVNFVPA